MKEITNTYWCDKCRKKFEQDIFEEHKCPNCNSNQDNIHMVLKDTNNNKDLIVVTEDNFQSVLPKNLIYFYHQLRGHSMTFSDLEIANYSLSRNAIGSNGKWYK